MVIKIRTFETLEKVKRYTKTSFKPCLGYSAYSDLTTRPTCADPTRNV